ncbi:MAG: hypothetical protein Q8L97_03025 [Nitrosomonas sp.]|uniref:hypothetical protein n=1 Tax=Nitrosomonas sp. TaxID=42353 RepID=UPI0027309669|nr:hypothetical protein [Nitrosomonas sp.]MDP1549123.1 hypothetical protein [Nitrosomonas sp.]
MRFHHILIYVLFGSAVITAVLDHWIDIFVILAVVLANAIRRSGKSNSPQLKYNGIVKLMLIISVEQEAGIFQQ